MGDDLFRDTGRPRRPLLSDSEAAPQSRKSRVADKKQTNKHTLLFYRDRLGLASPALPRRSLTLCGKVQKVLKWGLPRTCVHFEMNKTLHHHFDMNKTLHHHFASIEVNTLRFM